MMYPFKEAIKEHWQLISLVVQTALGHVEIEHGRMGQRNIMKHKRSVFEMMRRLARCFVECKGSDEDARGTRIGLELVRALSAESWEGRPTQLTQLRGLGPVFVRKLVSHDIKNVLQLAQLESWEIERILSRNKPFGANI